jgi:dihydrodipicolinate synthase/N-acetylneuraminate lyase
MHATLPPLSVPDLDTAIAFPIIAFRRGEVDYDAHARNVAFLVRNSFLDAGRRRVIGIGGSSLLHHLDAEEQLELARVTGEQAGSAVWYISGVVPSPPRQAAWLVREQMRLRRPPDAFLWLPIPGSYNPDGAYREMRRLCEELGRETGARFLLYLRDSALRDLYCCLVRESEHVLGVKIGTSVEDVRPAVEAVGDQGAVVWGIGDLGTRAVRLGAHGHTSGISLLSIRASDEINNAQRRGDFECAARIEEELRELEEIRFLRNRIYNYAALHTCLRIAAFPDTDPGEGGPFTAPPPPEILARLPAIVERLRPYHGGAL